MLVHISYILYSVLNQYLNSANKKGLLIYQSWGRSLAKQGMRYCALGFCIIICNK